MPETTVNKHGEAVFEKHKIWIPANTIVTAPSCYFVHPKDGRESQFRVFVAFGSNSGHYRGTLGFCKYIRHELKVTVWRVRIKTGFES
jgi:hypothetical protein